MYVCMYLSTHPSIHVSIEYDIYLSVGFCNCHLIPFICFWMGQCFLLLDWFVFVLVCMSAYVCVCVYVCARACVRACVCVSACVQITVLPDQCL